MWPWMKTSVVDSKWFNGIAPDVGINSNMHSSVKVPLAGGRALKETRTNQILTPSRRTGKQVQLRCEQVGARLRAQTHRKAPLQSRLAGHGVARPGLWCTQTRKTAYAPDPPELHESQARFACFSAFVVRWQDKCGDRGENEE